MLNQILNTIRKKFNSKTTAKERLKVTLAQDRAAIEKNIQGKMIKEEGRQQLKTSKVK